jgi:hypothetical protein
LGLHDVVFSNKIYDLLKGKQAEVVIGRETEKFWI